MSQSYLGDLANIPLDAEPRGVPVQNTPNTRISVVIASFGRAELLEQLIQELVLQTVNPQSIVCSVIERSDAPDLQDLSKRYPQINFEMVVGKKGMTRQRNVGMERVLESSDAVVFFDDDFVPSRYALEGILSAFNAFPEAKGVTGELLADGINGLGIPIDQARQIVREHDAKGAPGQPRVIRRLRGLYGCNMAFRTGSVGDLRFDERLPLYAWLEDIDFSMRVGEGMIQTDVLTGVHCGTKMGRERRGKLLGYSQIANPIYLVGKGTMPPLMAARHCARNFIANHLRAFNPEPWIDRRGRIAGNWLALADAARGRISPERILDFS